MDSSGTQQSEILERISDGVLALDENLVYTYANERAQYLLDEEYDDIVGAHIWDLFPEAEDSIVAERIQEARETGEETSYERYSEERDQWFEARLHPNEDGLVITFRDVTEQKEREEQLRRLHDATRKLVTAESATEVAERTSTTAAEILDLEANGVHLYDEKEDALAPTAVSSRGRELLGELPWLDEGIAWEVYQTGETRHYDDIREASGIYNEDTELRSELLIPLGEHGVFILSSTTVGAFDDEDVRVAKLLASSAETVLSERAKARQLRTQSRKAEQAEALFRNAQDAFFVVNVDRENDEYRFERVNPAYESLTGLSVEAVRGKTPGEIFGDDGDEVTERYDDCVEREEPISYVEQLDVPEPDSYWDSRIAPVIVDGEVVQIVGATRNVTEQKAYETRLEQQRDGLELLNEIVRHDIRNDLQVVASYAELLATRVSEDDREYVERILNNAENAVELTRSARDLAGTMLQTDQSTEPTPLKQTLLAQIDDIRTSYADAIVSVDGQIPSVTVSADQMLASVFRNVIKNAIQHNDKDVPEVAISVDVADETVRVAVSDNGPGIPDEQKTAIFGKDEKGLESEGTGIGLYLVNTLVEKYDGVVRVDDNEPEGTIVTITLPRA
ncbi:PAS domain-containing protein [Salinibaculum rarum]|uniref:PAS domain-containing protein n=1 Tax=Salinibaculum rarum TaxID=3058903 RepID=UPI00265F30D4|nr:PAS domain-containing protein [Salinibaculum sp. KK48]